MKHFSPSFFTLCAVLLLGACGGGGKNPGFGGGSPAVTLAPTTLTFSEVVGIQSTPQPITLTNSGTVPLNIASVVASTDYTVDSSACPLPPATLAAGANCIVNVTFTPAVAGATPGTITFTDNAANSPQTVTLTGTGT